MADAAKPEELEGPPHGAKPTAEPARVFISYSSHDAGVAQSVCSALETAGFTCWIAPRDVVPGKQYADGIIRAINDSTILVVVLSEHAVASAHVGKELERASSKRHPIIALRTDTAPLIPAFEYFLSESQWIDVGAAGVDEAIGKLTEAVRRHLKPDSLVHTGHRDTATQPTAQHSGTSPPGAQPSRGMSRIRNLSRLVA